MTNQYNLTELGWDDFFADSLQALCLTDCVPARVSTESRESYQVLSQHGELTAKISGKMRYQTDSDPAVGDWVAIKPPVDENTCIIHAILNRKSKFSRKVAGERTEEQIVSTNVDVVFIVSGLDGGRNLNLRRIERYLTLAWNSGASPVILLNKADLCSDLGSYIQEVESISMGIPVHAVSAHERTGMDCLLGYLGKGRTAAFLGSSGVGKSALINALLGIEKQATGEVKPDDRTGRHTTTRRELMLLPYGGVVIDTPGMRELQMWAGEDDLQDAFSDVTALAAECRFHDCTHNTEPGCAVKAAVAGGILNSARWESYQKLQKELRYLADRAERGARLIEKEKWGKLSQWGKEVAKQKRPPVNG
jgi:ribosome biogenesis GTPase / thiamine phosphate phosphatase